MVILHLTLHIKPKAVNLQLTLSTLIKIVVLQSRLRVKLKAVNLQLTHEKWLSYN